jgi:hypothetical protein
MLIQYSLGPSVLYRYWKPSISDHFYTTNINEIGTATAGQLGHHGYTSEGAVGLLYSRQVIGTVPLYISLLETGCW